MIKQTRGSYMKNPKIMSINNLFHLGMLREIPEVLPFPEGDDAGPILNLAPGNKHIDGTIEIPGLPNWNADYYDIPYATNSARGIYAFHLLEHLRYPLLLLREMQRVLQVGGSAIIVVPYYNSQMQAQDLDHKSTFCETTWANIFANPHYDDKGDWKLAVGMNIIIGVVERNLALMTQLIKIA